MGSCFINKRFRKLKVQIDNSGNYRDFINLTDLSILFIKSLGIKKWCIRNRIRESDIY